MAFEKNLGNGVAPDVAITTGQISLCWGHAPLTAVRLNIYDGYEYTRTTQPLGYFPKTNGRTIVYHDGLTLRRWELPYSPEVIPGKPVGNNPTGISPLGVCFYQRAGDELFKGGVYVESQATGIYSPTGIWQCYDNGTFVMMDQARAPWAAGYVHTSGPVSVGEGGKGGTLIHLLGKTHILYPGDDECRWPRVAVSEGRAAIVSWGSRGMRLWCGTLSEIEALPLADGPVPPPVDPPVEPPVQTPNHLETVKAVRAKYPTGEDLGVKRAWQITNEVAWTHRTEGFGLRKKPEGNNYNGYAVDIVFHLPSNQFVDVLGSSETIGAPQWSEVPGAIESEFAMPIDPALIDPPVDPPVDPPTEPPTTDLASRVSAIEEDLMKLRETLAGWILHGNR